MNNLCGISPEVAWDKLCTFEAAEEIREYFQFEGIKGIQKTPTSCPIANWIKYQTGLPAIVGFNIHIGYGDDGSSFNHTPMTLEFMKAFDKGIYPELISNKCQLERC